MNLFSISSLILSLSGLLFSFIVFRSDTKNKIGQYWFISCIPFSLWSFSLFMVTATSSLEVAIFWQYVLDISAIFLPASYFLFISELLGLKSKKVRFAYIFVAFLLAALSVTPLFKTGMDQLGDFYWVHPGPLYILFPIYFLLFAISSLFLLVRAYIHAPKESLYKRQLRNLLIAGAIGYLGGLTDFFPQVFQVYPFGNYLVILYIIFMVYGVIRYKLLSPKVIATQIFAASISLLSLFVLLRSSSASDWVINGAGFILMSCGSLLLVHSVNKEVSQREKIEALATDLQKANSRLTELDRQKSEFVSFATHQLRAPLTAMKGYASLILEGDLGSVQTGVKEAVSRIYESSKTLTSIVDDYLNLTRIELGSMKYAFETIDLKELVESVVAEIKPNIDKTGLKFSFTAEAGTDFRATADRDKLKQVIANLIDNSLKYTPRGSVDVSLSLDRSAHKFIFRVSDTGVGIPHETLPRLFQKFSRAENANKTNIKGTGLGLYVAKEIIEAHHGTVRAESPGEGKGSSFIVELEPFAKA
jgi:signal transduction histidine kinase